MATKKPRTHDQRIKSLEAQMEWVVKEAFQTVADSVAEQASACQAMIKVLADLHPDRRMVKCVTPEGAAFYQFRLISEIEAERKQKEAEANAATEDK